MTIGRIVLYCLAPGEIRPAIVTRVHTQELADLTVFLCLTDCRDDASAFLKLVQNSPMDQTHGDPWPGTWRWPVRS